MKTPRVKEVLFAAQRKGHRILLGTPLYGSGVEIQDDEEDTIWTLMSYMDGLRSVPEIIALMQKAHPELDRETILSAIDELIDQGFIEDASAPLPENISPREAERYSRNMAFFGWVDRKKRSSMYETQSILKCSRVSVLGLGANGASVALNLVLLGIGNVHLVDFDKVELSNLNRQVLYTEDDLGKEKIVAAKDALQKRNSQIRITTQSLKVEDYEDMCSLFHDSDLILICADRPYDKLREWANKAALKTRIPWIENFTGGPQCAVTLFVPFKTPCYQCVMHTAEEEEETLELVDPTVIDRQPSIPPVIAPTAAIIGDFTALQAVYFLIGVKPFIYGRIYRQNLLVLDHIISTKAAFWKDCPLCGPKSPYRNVKE